MSDREGMPPEEAHELPPNKKFLPEITAETVNGLISELNETRQLPESTEDALMDENPTLVEFLLKYKETSGEPEGFMAGALLTYTLLRRQAEADDMTKSFGKPEQDDKTKT